MRVQTGEFVQRIAGPIVGIAKVRGRPRIVRFDSEVLSGGWKKVFGESVVSPGWEEWWVWEDWH